MPWYVAHALMVLRPKSPIDQPLLCWENLLLINASNEDDAWEAAERRAKIVDATEEYAMSGHYGVPSRWEFAGIRKLVEVRHDTMNGSLCHGDELTYNTLLIDNDCDLADFVAGNECSVRYGNDVPER